MWFLLNLVAATLVPERVLGIFSLFGQNGLDRVFMVAAAGYLVPIVRCKETYE